VDDEFIYGIGVSNMKAGDAAYFCAVQTLVEAGVRLRGDVVLTYVVGELQGGVGTLALPRDGLRADCFVNSEPTDIQTRRSGPWPCRTTRSRPPASRSPFVSAGNASASALMACAGSRRAPLLRTAVSGSPISSG